MFVCLNGKGDFNYLCKIFVLVLVGENGIKEIVNGKGCWKIWLRNFRGGRD